jgi:hypothetical protein
MMSLITDELVRAIHTASPCRCSALARWAKNVLSSYCFCHVAIQVAPCIFVCVAHLGQSGQLARIPGIVTEAGQSPVMTQALSLDGQMGAAWVGPCSISSMS